MLERISDRNEQIVILEIVQPNDNLTTMECNIKCIMIYDEFPFSRENSHRVNPSCLIKLTCSITHSTILSVCFVLHYIIQYASLHTKDCSLKENFVSERDIRKQNR